MSLGRPAPRPNQVTDSRTGYNRAQLLHSIHTDPGQLEKAQLLDPSFPLRTNESRPKWALSEIVLQRGEKCDNLLVDHISEYTEFTYNSISFDENDLTLEHTAWFREWQEGVFNKQEKDHGRYERKKDEQIDEQYQHAMGLRRIIFSLGGGNAIMVSERDKKINQKPQASQNEKEMLKKQVEEPKIQVQECQVKI
ncbi:hypothetical protein GQ457_10G018590 [Hibiscus cannabinus]